MGLGSNGWGGGNGGAPAAAAAAAKIEKRMYERAVTSTEIATYRNTDTPLLRTRKSKRRQQWAQFAVARLERPYNLQGMGQTQNKTKNYVLMIFGSGVKSDLI